MNRSDVLDEEKEKVLTKLWREKDRRKKKDDAKKEEEIRLINEIQGCD